MVIMTWTHRCGNVEAEERMRDEEDVVEPRDILESLQLVRKPRDHPRQREKWLHLFKYMAHILVGKKTIKSTG